MVAIRTAGATPGEPCPACNEETWEWYGQSDQEALCVQCDRERPEPPEYDGNPPPVTLVVEIILDFDLTAQEISDLHNRIYTVEQLARRRCHEVIWGGVQYENDELHLGYTDPYLLDEDGQETDIGGN